MQVPFKQELKYAPLSKLPEGATEIQFRLIYEGRLPASTTGNTRREEKHEIRQAMHKQLAELWERVQFLKMRKDQPRDDIKPRLEVIADRYSRCGYRFVPLVEKRLGLACSLDILFLRRDNPGDLVTHGGDLDNRIKTLFDALRMPENCDEVRGFSVGQDEDPFYCLLEDDALITDVKITTDRLIKPLSPSGHIHDVLLIVHVTTQIVTDYTRYYREEGFAH